MTIQVAGRVKEITSTANPLIKEIRALSLKKNRDGAGVFIAEGLKLVTDAIDTGWPVRTLVYSKLLADAQPLAGVAARARASGADILKVSDKVLAAIARRDNPQMVIGVFRQVWAGIDELAESEAAGADILLALDRIRDPGNLGTIIRTADAAGIRGVVLVGETTDPFALEAVRATMGSIFNIGLARIDEASFIEWLDGYTGRVVGTHLKGAVDYRAIEWAEQPTLLVMGNEQQGLTDRLATACGKLVYIPMARKADSLNLAIATGIMLFEAGRSRLAMPARSGDGEAKTGDKRQ